MNLARTSSRRAFQIINRWEFRRYDHRRTGVSNSRGWLHYVGVGPVLVVIGFHRGWRYRTRRSRTWTRRTPAAWIELTLYAGKKTFDVYPGCRIREAWL